MNETAIASIAAAMQFLAAVALVVVSLRTTSAKVAPVLALAIGALAGAGLTLLVERTIYAR